MDFEAMYHHLMADPIMTEPPDVRLREDRRAMSDSWSDMSDCEDNVDLGLSAGAYSNRADRGTESDSDRLTRSLDIDHGILNDQEESQSLPSYYERTRSMGRNANSSTRNTEASVSSEPDQGDKIKVKLMSAWNNMRYGWTVKTKTNFKVDSPIWLLGKCYHCTKEEKDLKRHSGHGKTLTTTFDTFKSDFISRIWFTYRKEIPRLPTSLLTSDVGWGCMLRSGQMMLAQALIMHFLGRDWRWFPSQKPYEILYHRQIVKYFGDNLSESSPFSIHRLVNIGKESGKLPGDWYGPASVAHVLREATEQAAVIDPLLGQVCVYVAQDCTVYKQDVIDLCSCPISRQTSSRSSSCSSHEDTAYPGSSAPSSASAAHSGGHEHQYRSDQNSSHPPAGGHQRFNPFDRDGSHSYSGHLGEGHPSHWRAVVILIPVRLGGEALNPIYTPCVQSLLVHDSCVGIIGGKPKHSLYFLGWQEDKLIHLDPHFCQEHVDVTSRDFPLASFHCMSPRKMSFSKMDPSCTFGFYCRTREDFDNFVRESQQMASPPKEKGLYPMFVFQEGRSSDLSYSAPGPSDGRDRILRVQHVDSQGRIKKPSKATDDFVFL